MVRLIIFELEFKFLIWDLPAGNDAWLKEYFPSFLSTLLVIPDNPEEGVLFLIKSVLNGINKYSWDKHQGYKPLAILDGVKLLASACQETYPYTYEVFKLLNLFLYYLPNILGRA